MKRILALPVLAGLVLWAAEARASLTLTKTPNPPSISAGDVARFDYVVHNGSTTSLSVGLIDTLPAGVTWSENSAFCTMGSGRNLSCSFGTLAAGVSRSVTVTGTTNFADCGTLSSMAVAGGSTGGDQATAGVDVLCPDMTGWIFPDSIGSNVPFAFTVAVRNGGAGIARSVTYSYPYGIFADLTWALEPSDPLCAIGASSMDCTIGDLGPGEGRATRVVATKPPDSHCGSVFDQMTVAAANEPSPPCCSTQTFAFSLHKPGDASGNCVTDVGDVFYLINFLFAGGPSPVARK